MRISLYLMSLFYFVAGLNHFVHPLMYKKVIPEFIPIKDSLVSFSGFCEIILAVLLIPLITRSIAAWSTIVFLIAVFPANIQMVVTYLHESDPNLWFAILRLPVQLILIYWAYLFTK